MTTLEVFVLGIVEGILGFLPLDPNAVEPFVWRWILGRESPVPASTADLFRIGAFAGILAALRGDLFSIAKWRPAWLGWLILAAVPLAVFGHRTWFMRDMPDLAPWGFLVMGGVFWVVSKRLDFRHETDAPRKEVAATDALLMGLAQVAALCPGVSRLGLSYASGVICGLDRRAAAVFSLLLLAPALGFHLIENALRPGAWPDLPPHLATLGILAAFSTALLAAGPLLTLFESGSVGLLAYACWILAAVAILAP